MMSLHAIYHTAVPAEPIAHPVSTRFVDCRVHIVRETVMGQRVVVLLPMMIVKAAPQGLGILIYHRNTPLH